MLKFLQKGNGAHLQSLNWNTNFQTFLLYSTQQITPSFATYLEQSLGFSEQQSLSTSSKLAQLRPLKKVSDLKSTAKATSIIDLLKKHGFDQTHIRKAVSLDPLILFCNVNALKGKLDVLQDLGLCGSDLIHLISSKPGLLRKSLHPAVQSLKTVLINNEDVVKLLKKMKYNLLGVCANRLVANVALMRDYGISSEKIQKRFLQHTGAFFVKTESLWGRMVRVEEELGIPRESQMFLYGLCLLGRYKQKTIESKCGLFESSGWRKSDVASLMRQNPYCFVYSHERIKKSLSFLGNEMGYEPAYLIKRPSLLNYSVEKRLIPRNRVLLVLKEKGLLRSDYPLYNLACLTESDFLRKFILPFRDKVPDLEQLYVGSKDVQQLGTNRKEEPSLTC